MAELQYQSGFGNQHSTEAVAGALPKAQNSPQKTPFGLYAEQVSGSAFTVPRAESLRSWQYRLRPSAQHNAYSPLAFDSLRTAPCHEMPASPNRLRWNPLPINGAADFIDSLVTIATNGDARLHKGLAVHLYAASRSMSRVFYDTDGELLIVPQTGALKLVTEFGVLNVTRAVRAGSKKAPDGVLPLTRGPSRPKRAV